MLRLHITSETAHGATPYTERQAWAIADENNQEDTEREYAALWIGGAWIVGVWDEDDRFLGYL